MKKTLTFLLLLSFAFVANAQLLWKISGNGLTKDSYIFGSHHLAPLSIVDSIPNLKQVLADAEMVYGEVVMEDMMKPENLQMMQKQMILTGDTTLKTLYSEKQYNEIGAVVKKYVGMDLSAFDRVKPVTLNTQLALIFTMQALKGFNPQEQLDGWFQAEAKKAGKPVAGLETLEQQTQVLYGSQTLQRQAHLLYCTATHVDENMAQVKRMNDAYMHQDLDRLLEVLEEKMNNDCDSRPEEMDVLIYNRNANWVKVMPTIMKDKSTLFVVGGGHLPGDRGVLHLLKAAGYTVEAY